MSRRLTIAVLQAAFGEDTEQNCRVIEALSREAASEGADVIVPPELFGGPYFCQTQDESHFARAAPAGGHPIVKKFAELARELGVSMPISFFEKDGAHYYNSVAMIGGEGHVLGLYRKSHIPDGPGYQEKFYFKPGDTGPQVWTAASGQIGVGICWDQWFPEHARSMALKGADVLVYPTAIGSEPQDRSLDTAKRWQRAMVGHAVANVMPVAAANRIGNENGQIFYGCSFIAGPDGEILSELGREDTGYAIATFDLDAIDQERAAWGFFRDRRSDLY